MRLLRATEAPTPVTWPRRKWAFRLQTPLRALTEAMLDAMPSVLYTVQYRRSDIVSKNATRHDDQV
jgi:hypothetical protein